MLSQQNPRIQRVNVAPHRRRRRNPLQIKNAPKVEALLVMRAETKVAVPADPSATRGSPHYVRFQTVGAPSSISSNPASVPTCNRWPASQVVTSVQNCRS